MTDASEPRSVTVGTVLRDSPSPARSTSSCLPGRTASTAASPSPTRRKPDSRYPVSTRICRRARARLRPKRGSLPRDADRRGARPALRRVFSHPCHACSSPAAPTRRRRRSRKPTAPAFRCCGRRPPRPTRSRGFRPPRHTPGPERHGARRADGHPRPRRPHGRRERHRKKRVRARPRRPRASPGVGRRRRSALPRRVVHHRDLSGTDAASHGDPRARPDQRAGSVRRRVHALVEARRARRAARTLGARAGV